MDKLLSWSSWQTLFSGKRKEPKPKLLGPDIFGWGGGLSREGVGAEKFGMSLETREIKLFWWDIAGFCWDIPAVPEKFEKKCLCSILGPYFQRLAIPQTGVYPTLWARDLRDKIPKRALLTQKILHA